MKRSTAARNLREIAETAEDLKARMSGPDFEWRLHELWVAGDVLDDHNLIDHVVVIVVLDVPAAEVPNLALHAEGESFSWLLRLDKRPLLVRYRPRSMPAWDHVNRRVARFWSTSNGTDAATIEDLSVGNLTAVKIVEPTRDEILEQLRKELPGSSQHLREVLDNYWESAWRRRHKGNGIQPEDHLWRAAEAVATMHEALDELAH